MKTRNTVNKVAVTFAAYTLWTALCFAVAPPVMEHEKNGPGGRAAAPVGGARPTRVQIEEQIAKLNANDYETREAADNRLRSWIQTDRLGPEGMMLIRAAARNPALEPRRRAERILQFVDDLANQPKLKAGEVDALIAEIAGTLQLDKEQKQAAAKKFARLNRGDTDAVVTKLVRLISDGQNQAGRIKAYTTLFLMFEHPFIFGLNDAKKTAILNRLSNAHTQALPNPTRELVKFLVLQGWVKE